MADPSMHKFNISSGGRCMSPNGRTKTKATLPHVLLSRVAALFDGTILDQLISDGCNQD